MKKIILTIFLFSFFFAIPISAHQPRLVTNEFTEIKNPEVSQAFYGELLGEPDYYQIKAEGDFKLYLGILVPDLEGIDKDVSAEVVKDGEVLYLLDGLKHNWTYYFEKHAGDGYYYGPELKDESKKEEVHPRGVAVGAGVYDIKIFSPDNQGKYTLAIGEREEFPAGEIVNIIKTLPNLKSDFFNKSPLTAFFNLVGLYLFVFLLIIAVIAVLLVWGVKKIKK